MKKDKIISAIEILLILLAVGMVVFRKQKS